MVRIDDLPSGPRWSDFAALTAPLGVRSILSVRLLAHRREHAALTVSPRRPGPSTAPPSRRAGGWARTRRSPSSACDRPRTCTPRRGAATSSASQRNPDGARCTLTEDDAVQVLVRASQHSDRKLVDVATRVVETGALPELE
ncbi:ANTAR domain-containing protein [Nakamurella leprariae]|uniref:ANTAR domain-containing protein n=1 Tax=Nakamurella leprariae TaxID=2803911 RepID=A0A939BZT9_9ACTN|nr:ANTAR domain-containing protein [Nakamurella leprariae]MBM9468520.1 ANTAR domain-containing protein [Nakamurella leprariae]